MALISKSKTYADNDSIIYSDLNANWDALYNLVNGNIDNANINASAAIDPTKISGTSVTLTGVQTIAGQKTLVKPILNAVQTITADTDGTTITFDMTTSNFHVVTLGGNRTLAVSNVSVGQAFIVRLVQDATGGRTVTWFGTIKWPYGITPTLTTTAAKADVFGFICTSTGNYDGFIVGQSL